MHPRKSCKIFCGRQGCGKGSQSKRLAERYGLPRLEMGDHFRHLKNTSRDPHVLRKLARLKSGALVDDRFAIWQAKLWLMRHRGYRGVVLDGVIRTLPQLDALLPFIGDRGFDLSAIWLDTPVEECVRRILANPRPGRDDDNPDALAERFKAYDAMTAPLKQAMIDRGVEVHVISDVGLSIEEVWGRVQGAFLSERVIQMV